MMASEKQRALRAHIQGLLYSYALTHLTTDYVVFTHGAVNEVLSASLHTIPETDPTSLVLEPTLSELIAEKLKLSQLKGYQERLSVDQDAKVYLKDFFRSIITDVQGNDSKSDRGWLEDDKAMPWEPMSPTLTMRAIRETPKFRGKPATELVAGPAVSVLKKFKIGGVDADMLNLELVYEEMQTQDVNEILGHKLAIDTKTRSAVMDCIRESRPLPRIGADQADRHVNALINGDDIDTTCGNAPQLASPPLFARDRNPGSDSRHLVSTGLGLSKLTQLESLVLPTQPGSDDSCDLYEQHMTVVNGWETYNIPSSPTPSLQSSRSENVDELDLDQYLPSSSPDALAKFIDNFLPAKMEDHLIPRGETVEEVRAAAKAVGKGESLNSLLSFLQSVPKTPQRHNSLHETGRVVHVKIITTPHSAPSSPSTIITASMLGQPPTALDIEPCADQGPIDLDDPSSDDLGLNRVLRVMYRKKGVAGTTEKFTINPQDYILKERLDDRESYLMDVPDLPPPNEHPPSGMYIPTTPQALLVLKDARDNHSTEAPGGQLSTESHPREGFLQEVKGFKSLNIELSWRPFNFGTTKPTHEEVAGLVENVKIDCLLDLVQFLEDDHQERGQMEGQLAKLICDSFISADSGDDTYDTDDDKIWFADEYENISLLPEDFGDVSDIILTTAERRRIVGLPNILGSASEHTPGEDGDSDERPVKRIRFSSPEVFEYTPAPSFENSQPRAEGHQEVSPQDDYLDEVEDSGVFIPEAFDVQPRASRFTQLASDAQGFDGPNENGEVITDVDPLLREDWDPSSPAAISPPRFCMDGLTYQAALGDSGITDEPENSADDSSPILSPVMGAAAPDAADGGTSQGRALNCSRATAPVYNTFSRGEESRPQGDMLLESSLDGTDLLSSRSARHRLHEFMRLRCQKVSSAVQAALRPPISPVLPSDEASSLSFGVPPELVNNQTLTLSGARSWPGTTHRYLASLDLIQKRGLVRTLSAPQCAVHLIEREYLDGADILLDCETAVMFSPLRTLPTQNDTLTAAINKLSWRFSYLLVVFESFPAAEAHLHAGSQPEFLTVNPFSPPVIKAVRKVRRDIGIAEAYYNKRSETTVNFAFPLTLVDVAKSIRLYGDLAQERDVTGGVLWDDRRWLDADDEDLDERDLATIDGMNVFAAAVILTSTTLDDFLDRTAEERFEQFGSLIGKQRMSTFNTIIARRKEAIDLPSSSPPITSNTSSSQLHSRERTRWSFL